MRKHLGFGASWLSGILEPTGVGRAPNRSAPTPQRRRPRYLQGFSAGAMRGLGANPAAYACAMAAFTASRIARLVTVAPATASTSVELASTILAGISSSARWAM